VVTLLGINPDAACTWQARPKMRIAEEGRLIMRTIDTTIAAIFAALLVAAVASPASAQVTPQREAAIERCIAQAHQQWPGGDEEAHRQRVAAYKACMTAAGQNP